MIKGLLAIILMVTLSACINVESNQSISVDQEQSDYRLKVEDAKGFTIHYGDQYTTIKINSLSDKYPFYDSILIANQAGIANAKYLPGSLNKIACQSSTHIAFLDKLNKINLLCGISEMDYMPKDAIYDKVAQLNVQELNNNGVVEIERLVKSNADLFLMYPFEWQSEKYKAVNIPTLLVAEYLESTPIARLEWLKFFGCLLNEPEMADSVFESIKHRYNDLVVPVDSAATVMFNLPFKENWNMPSYHSLTAQLAKDAGLNYIVPSTGQDNIVLSKEIAWEKGISCEYWIIMAGRPEGFSFNDLLEEASIYKDFRSVKEKKVIFCNTSYSGYFTEGVVEPDVMLKDLLFLTGKISDHTPKYFKFLSED